MAELLLPPHGAAHRAAWFKPGAAEADVLVVGGGVMGASVFHHLARAGLKVVLAERGDFANGTSQGSAGLVWGGLLYLRHGHLREVAAWCRERDRLEREWPDLVRPHLCDYLLQPARRSALAVKAGLMAYGWLGGRPCPAPQAGSVGFREARLTASDARFTWHWIASAPGSAAAFNRCEAREFAWDGKRWQTTLADRLGGGAVRLSARWVVNACGPWAGALDRAAGVSHPAKLALSRGTSLVVPRTSGDRTLIREHPVEDDVLTLVPFGAHGIWGSTEVMVDTPEEGFDAPGAEVAGLLDLHRRLIGPLAAQDVVAVRCGVRAMAVPNGWKRGDARSQELNRGLRLLADPARPWLSLYGGKLSGCAAAGRDVARRIANGAAAALAPLPVPAPPTVRFPGLAHPVPDPAWCREHEQCWSLDDYLRRRTDIHQSVPRAGCGRNDEHLPALARAAQTLAGGDAAAAKADLEGYLHAHVARHDRLLGLAALAS